MHFYLSLAAAMLLSVDVNVDGNAPVAMRSETPTNYSVPAESTYLLRKLVVDERLKLPKQFTKVAREVRFSGAELPFLHARADSNLNLKLCRALAAVIANERFAGKVQAGQIAVHCDHPALFVFAATTTTMNGKIALDPRCRSQSSRLGYTRLFEAPLPTAGD
ncbi:hypothetical protein EW146_g1592 [Bondarzewia mesenterica]|uniref:Uncharacterized protein n=1 Tax=Bondarzewia mesenterica TaxID=1095465 RepID=A0A4V3XG15_9AGAM|nr:hypothetical protein EW146_g1592 [Bondarzewia mesenterica]